MKRIFVFCLMLSGLVVQSLQGESRNLAFSLPFLVPVGTPSGDTPFRGEYLFPGSDVALATEWSSWGYAVPVENMPATKKKAKEAEEASLDTESLLSRGQSVTVMVERFSNSKQFSGFHWGLGFGHKSQRSVWRPGGGFDVGRTDENSAFDLSISGVTYSGRLGYRYVWSDVGFLLGTSLGLKHLSPTIQVSKLEDSVLTDDQKKHLKRRLETSGHVNLEVGWAF